MLRATGYLGFPGPRENLGRPGLVGPGRRGVCDNGCLKICRVCNFFEICTKD